MLGDPFYEINPEIWPVCISQAEVCFGLCNSLPSLGSRSLSSVNYLSVFARGHSEETPATQAGNLPKVCSPVSPPHQVTFLE